MRWGKPLNCSLLVLIGGMATPRVDNETGRREFEIVWRRLTADLSIENDET
jgi:hypothetical protein